MSTRNVINSLAAILLVAFIFNACSDQQELTPNSAAPTKELQITNRSTLPNSHFELHNDFVEWLFDNYSDSAFYYATAPLDFMKFIKRKMYIYNSSNVNFIPLVMDNQRLIFPYPYYNENEGFTLTNDTWERDEYTALYLVLDSVAVALKNEDTEVEIQPIIQRGKNRIQAMTTFPNEDQLLDVLTQASYSLSLMYDLEDDLGDGMVDPCSLVGVVSDIEAHNFFSELGDLDPGDPMYEFASNAVIGISAYAFANCHY